MIDFPRISVRKGELIVEQGKQEASAFDLWEILVPEKDNQEIPFAEEHHEAFRETLRQLPGNNGTTRHPAGDGDWKDRGTGRIYYEKMIPIRFRARRVDAERVTEHGRQFYRQLEVMTYKVARAEDIIMARVEDRNCLSDAC